VRNLPLASSSSIPLQGASGSSKTCGTDWEQVALVYNKRELAIPVNLWAEVITICSLQEGESHTRELHLTQRPSQILFSSAGRQ
jgi:hypothetical protein